MAEAAGTSLAKGSPAILAFNRGLVSRLALGRVDLKRMAFSAAEMVNWIPRVLGSMMLRPGLAFLGSMASRPKMLPFIFSTDDTALIELTNRSMRVWIDDELVHRPVVSTAISNGSFTTDLTGWTDADEPGGVSQWALGGYMELLGNGTAMARRYQGVSVAAGDAGVEHAVHISVARGPVLLSVGSSIAGDDYIRETELGTGEHSLAFTPSSTFYVTLFSRLDRIVLVDSATIESAGAMSVTTPWLTADLRRIRWDQSADVLFVACKGYQQRRIERRAARSWSVVLYQPTDGPFRAENVGPITITPSGLTGNITLAASQPLFKSTQVGALFRLTSEGQAVSEDVTAEDVFSDEIRVTNVGESRRFTITRAGTWSATVTLQRSIGEVGLWEDVEQYTTNDSITYADELDNQIVYYRIGVKTGDFTSGTAELALFYPLGSITGVVRVTAFTNSTTVSAEVLSELGGTEATDVWSEGAWSDYRGWPTTVVLAEGRLWWMGKNGVVGSISDAYESFDQDFEGDAGPINRTIGSGPVDDIQWAAAVRRLLVGAEGAEMTLRSSALDEPLTPTNFNIKDVSSQGSAEVPAVKVDNRVIFVQRSGTRVYELGYALDSGDYDIGDLTAIVPEIGSPGIVAIAIQRQPDTRLHCLRADGTVALAVIDRKEEVLAWEEIETDGEIEDIVILPGVGEDVVYYVVNRALGSSGVITLTITTVGSGYSAPPTLSFSGGGGSNAAGSVTLKLVSVSVAAAGSGYLVNDIVPLFDGIYGTIASVLVTSVGGGGEVLGVSINAAGSYSEAPGSPALTEGGTGTGLELTVSWGLGEVTIVSNGGAYDSAPTVTLNGDGAGGAIVATVATATLSGHYLEKWALESECRGGTLNKQADSFIVSSGTSILVGGGFVSALSALSGSGYTAAPSLSFSGGGGAGAAATVGLKLIDVVPAAFGSGYARGNVLTVNGGTYTRPAKVQVLETWGSGFILSLAIVDEGDYSVLPHLGWAFVGVPSVSGGSGSGAFLWCSWGLSDPVITNQGAGYTSPPVVTVSAVPLAIGNISSNAPGIAGTVTASLTALTTSTPALGSNISGLSHLEGREVVVWADGRDLSPEDENGVQQTYTVTGGQVSLDEDVATAVVGLPYTGQWKSTKLSQVVEEGQVTGLCATKRIARVGFVLVDTHHKGLKFGPDFEHLDNLPGAEDELVVTEDTVWEHYDQEPISFPGESDTDARLCLQAQAPRPCTVLAVVIPMESNQ